jgi:beta-glucanase (GH16 family)
MFDSLSCIKIDQKAKMKLRKTIRAIGIIAATSLLFIPMAQGSAKAKAKAPVYKLLWSDEFSRKLNYGPDPSKWTYDTMVGPNSEKEYYTTKRANTTHDGKGHLVITANLITENDPLYNYCLPDLTDTCWYSSGRIKTAGLVSFQYGKISARIKMPKGQGTWPAFWMLGQDLNQGGTWPECGEIDIVEGKEEMANYVFGTVHGPGYSGGQGIGDVYQHSEPLSSGWHEYSIVWAKNSIKWYFDGKLFHSISPTFVYGNQWVFNQQFFIILNLAMGGQFVTGGIDPSVTQAKMYIDYVRAYSVNGVGKVFKR